MAANVSSISQALANGATSVHIPKPFGLPEIPNKDPHVGHKSGFHSGLPTPPNSISPYLPAHSLSARARKDFIGSPPALIESDIELGDAVDIPTNHHAAKQGYSTSVDSGAPAHGVISPTLIARDYLPEIVLGKGQVAVKEVINQLSTSLPGFTDIPPAKARRIVVGALETRHGGPDGTVAFEKTGWGRWVGRLKQQPRREPRAMRKISEDRHSPAIGPSVVRRNTSAMKIPGHSGHVRKQRRLSHGSWAAESNASTYDPADRMDVDIFHQDTEDIRIDGDGDNVNRYRGSRRRREVDDEPFFSDTDVEDWASMGVDALRPGSYSGVSMPHHHRRTSRRSRTKSPFTAMGQSLSSRQVSANHRQQKPALAVDFTGVDADSQERDAIEALMSMGSM